MKGKKFSALALISAAVMAMANITASADIPTIYGFDNIKQYCTKTIDTHICQNYINLNINSRGHLGKKMVIKNKDGEVVAKYTTGEQKFSYVKDSILDISGMTSPKQIDALKTKPEYVTRGIKPERFMLGRQCIMAWKNEYLPYASYESKSGENVYPMLTSEIYIYNVDNQSKMEDMNESYTVRAGDYAAYVAPGCKDINENMYFNFGLFNSQIFREHAGQYFYDSMPNDTYSPDIMVYTERTSSTSSSSGGVIRDGIKRQDHDISYKLYRLKFEDMIKSYSYVSDYETLLSYGRQPGKFAILIASGSMMSYTTTDSEGYVKFWADPDHLSAIEYKCLANDFKGTSGTLRIYNAVKLNTLMEMPKGGQSLYNIPAGTYTVEFEDPADNEGYRILNNTFTVNNSVSLQTSDEITIIKSVLGDVNFDGKIDVEDAVMVIGNVNGVKALTNAESRRADIDGNKVIDIEDAVAIIAHVNGVKVIA